MGINTERMFLQHTQQGDLVILYMEVDDTDRVSK